MPPATCWISPVCVSRRKVRIRKLESNEKGGVIEFNEKNNVNPVWLIGLLQKQPQHFRPTGRRA